MDQQFVQCKNCKGFDQAKASVKMREAGFGHCEAVRQRYPGQTALANSIYKSAECPRKCDQFTAIKEPDLKDEKVPA